MTEAISAQAVFDEVARHLARQGGPALDDAGMCCYRGINGTKCAAGVMILDSEYEKKMEGASVNAIDLPARLQPHVDLLRQLQGAHDAASYDAASLDRSGWRDPRGPYGVATRLARIAKTFDLDPSVIDEVFPEEDAL